MVSIASPSYIPIPEFHIDIFTYLNASQNDIVSDKTRPPNEKYNIYSVVGLLRVPLLNPYLTSIPNPRRDIFTTWELPGIAFRGPRHVPMEEEFREEDEKEPR